uniref:Transcription factor n=1 Tax=Rhizophora mucronata TaxID=61149 RepID=A0A2P2LHU4_RHIMU
MGEDCGSWFPQQHIDWQSPNMDYIGAPIPSAEQNTVPLFGNPSTANQTMPKYASPETPQSWAGQATELHGWFYCLPRFRQAFMPAPNSTMNQKVPTAPYDNVEKELPRVDSGCAPKKFLVFDQSGDQTTLIFSSGFGAPPQCTTSWIPKPTNACNLKREELGIKENLNYHLWSNSMDEFGENNGGNSQSEMHEDTEELNALLYSDDDSDYSGDEEVTSTGHSPSTMTAFDKPNSLEKITEEVASSDGSSKKRKLSDGCCSDLLSLVDPATSIRPIRGFEYEEDDAESRCANGTMYSSQEAGSELGNKRMRKERIRETVSVLQNMIPSGKGKDAIEVLDEAIHYLNSLKHKVRALGLDAP